MFFDGQIICLAASDVKERTYFFKDTLSSQNQAEM